MDNIPVAPTGVSSLRVVSSVLLSPVLFSLFLIPMHWYRKVPQCPEICVPCALTTLSISRHIGQGNPVSPISASAMGNLPIQQEIPPLHHPPAHRGYVRRQIRGHQNVRWPLSTQAQSSHHRCSRAPRSFGYWPSCFECGVALEIVEMVIWKEWIGCLLGRQTGACPTRSAQVTCMCSYLTCYRKYRILGSEKPSGTESFMTDSKFGHALICGWGMLANTLPSGSLQILGQLGFRMKRLGAFQGV